MGVEATTRKVGRVPAEEAVAAGAEATEEVLAAGYGGEIDVGIDGDDLATSVALDALSGLRGDDAADCGGAIADCESAAGANRMG